MTESKFRTFIKGYDRYSKPVTLTYNSKGGFRTTCGGIATIVTFFMFLIWFCLELLGAYTGEIISSSKTITTFDSETERYPTWNLTLYDLLITSRLESTDPEV